MSQSYSPKDYLREALHWLGPDGTAQNGFWTMTEIAGLYKNNTTSHDVGNTLEELGYRNSAGYPTQRARSGGFVAPRGDPKFTWA